MGQFWSVPRKIYLDGLRLPSPVYRDFDVALATAKLDQLLRASINNYSLSSIAPPLVSAYFLGASAKQLTELMEIWVPQLCKEWPEDDPVADSIGKSNLDEFFDDQRYEQRYYEYFRDCLTEEPNWDNVVTAHISELWHRLLRNNMRPLIVLAAALESDNSMIACEALAMACTDAPSNFVIDPKMQVPNKQVGDRYFRTKFRRIARIALTKNSLDCVLIVHACAELFLSPKLRLIPVHYEVLFLNVVERYVESAIPGEMRNVTPFEALETQNHEIISFTRARLVLEKLAEEIAIR